MAEIEIKEAEKKVIGDKTSNYEDIKKISKSIPFKQLSWNTIKNKIREVRIQRLEKKLEKSKADIVNDRIKYLNNKKINLESN